MNRLTLILSLAVLLLTATGCEKEEYARYASYGNIVYVPSVARVGDTVTFKVEVLDAGNRIYHADYLWSCKNNLNGEKVFNEEVRVTAPDGSRTITKIPTFKWVFTSPGSYTITMSAYFKYSMQDENGQMRSGNSASRRFEVKAKY